jgi:hypothetical protein
MIGHGIYLLLLRMHPRSFRERFTDEMPWLFDETLANAGLFKLYADAAYSLAEQHITNDPVPPSAPLPFQAVHLGTLDVTRIVQAGSIASLAMIRYLKMLQPPPPLLGLAKTDAVRRYVPDTCFDTRSIRVHRGRRARINR